MSWKNSGIGQLRIRGESRWISCVELDDGQWGLEGGPKPIQIDAVGPCGQFECNTSPLRHLATEIHVCKVGVPNFEKSLFGTENFEKSNF